MSRKIQRKQLNVDLSEGRTTSTGPGDYGTINVSGLNDSDQLEDAFHKLEVIIDKLSPATPPGLGDAALSLASGLQINPITPTGYVSSGLIADGALTPVSVNNILRNATSYSFEVTGLPAGNTDTSDTGYAWDADSGTLSAILDSDSASEAQRTFTTGNDVGTATSTNSALVLSIDAEKDYFSGEAGKEGFWNAFTSSINVDPSLLSGTLSPSVVQHLLEITHSVTGGQTFQFYIENSTFPTISGTSASGDMTEIVSGVATFQESDNITANFTTSNAVKFFYRDNILSASGAVLTNGDYLVGSPAADANTPVTDLVLINPLPNAYSNANIIINYTAKDVFNNQTTSNLTLSNKRVDTKSLLIKSADAVTSSGRYLGADAEAVTDGVGNGLALSTYDHEVSLLLGAYAQQLQVLNGKYRYPLAFNYSTYNYFDGANQASPDYSAISGAFRWASFSFDLVTNKSLTQQVNLVLADNDGIITTNQNANRCDLYYKVITWAGVHGGTVAQETVWIQAVGNVNAATFDGGDPYMVGYQTNDETTQRDDATNGAHIGVINENSRTVTVGNNITGNGTNVSVHVRISVAQSETYSFSGVDVTL